MQSFWKLPNSSIESFQFSFSFFSFDICYVKDLNIKKENEKVLSAFFFSHTEVKQFFWAWLKNIENPDE